MPAKKVTLNVTSDEKPSLSSLKIDKKKPTTAQKRAVKRIEAGVSKKVPTKVVKKAGENKVTIHRAKKVAAPVKAAKPTKAPKSKKISETLKVAEEPSKKFSDYVTLPTNISIRAREKALVILQAVQEDFKEPAQKIAYVSGLCFMLLGATLALSFATSLPESHQLTAQLPNTTISSTTKTVTTTTQAILEPDFKLLDQLPVELTSKTSHRMRITNTSHVDVRLFSLANGTQIDVQVDDKSAEDFSFELDPASIKPDRYVVKLFLEAKDGSKYVRRLGEIVIPVPPNQTPGTTSQPAEEEIEEEEVEEEVATTTEEVAVEEPRLIVKTLRTTLADKTSISVTTNVDAPKVTLFIRKLRSIQGKELGSAEKHGDTWYYFFDTINEPNGEYEISARMLFEGKFVHSNTVKVKIENFVPRTESQPGTGTVGQTSNTQTPPSAPAPITEPLRTPELQETEETASTTIRTFSDFKVAELSDSAEETEQIVPEEKQQIDALAGLYQNELRELFKRYAVAIQSGDPLIIELAEKELLAGKDKLVTDVLNTQDINHTADNVDTLFTDRILEVKKRVDTFEELRRTASNNESATDSDGDGIADFDEIHLYQTNPEAGDTDNDGVTDGVEIMRGFNPLNSSAEAVIKYELPQETVALVHEEVLKIDAVAPVIRSDISEDAPEVHASIKGKALPNSYVTLYVFSTPMIVTVRTDQDGSFEYTFEKELENGEHEVYVAVTDNTGAIVAKSNPFKFIKEAQAFTPVDDEGGEVAAATTVTAGNNFSLYNAVIGLAILALGLILLMLGIGMREKEAQLVSTAHDLKPS
jgi:Bacterial Ig-like domain